MRAAASSTLIPARSRSSAAEGRSRRVSTRPLYAAIRTRMSQSWRTTVAHQSTEDTHHTGLTPACLTGRTAARVAELGRI
jgi:hypothetical protein